MQDRVSNRPEREKAERLAERIELLAMAHVFAHGDRRTLVDLTSAFARQRSHAELPR